MGREGLRGQPLCSMVQAWRELLTWKSQMELSGKPLVWEVTWRWKGLLAWTE